MTELAFCIPDFQIAEKAFRRDVRSELDEEGSAVFTVGRGGMRERRFGGFVNPGGLWHVDCPRIATAKWKYRRMGIDGDISYAYTLFLNTAVKMDMFEALE